MTTAIDRVALSDIVRDCKPYVIVRALGAWGRGSDLEEARENCRKAYGRGFQKARKIADLVLTPGEVTAEPFVDGAGRLVYYGASVRIGQVK